MKNFLNVALFSILIVLAFAGYSNFGIPQIKPAPPPTEEKVDLEAMTMDGFIALGERLLNGKGTCTLCHNALGRAPALDKLAENVAKHLADPRYKGEAKDPQTYLYESLVDPSIYVVSGFGKAGSDDTESPMPDVTGGGIGMSEVEVLAVTAYMLDSNGMDNTVEIPTDLGESSVEATQDSAGEGGGARKLMATVEEIIAANACGACHKIGQDVGELGPDLSNIGAKLDRAYLRRALLDPNADIAAGYAADIMPATLGEALYAQELEMLVEYLAGLGGSAGAGEPASAAPSSEEPAAVAPSEEPMAASVPGEGLEAPPGEESAAAPIPSEEPVAEALEQSKEGGEAQEPVTTVEE